MGHIHLFLEKYKNLNHRRKSEWIWELLFLVLFATANTLTQTRLAKGSFAAFYPMQIVWFLLSLAGGFLVVELLNVCVMWAGEKKWKQIRRSSRSVFWISFGILFFLYGGCMLTFFPGTTTYDSIYMLVRDTDIAVLHPYAFCLLIRIIKTVVFALGGNARTAMAVYTLFQVLVTAGIFAGCIAWMKAKRIPRFWIVLTVLYYGGLSVFSFYSVTFIKDSLFAAFCVLWVPLLYEVAACEGKFLQNWKNVCVYGFVMIATSLLRSNGIYVVLGISLVLILSFRKYWKSFLIMTIVTYLISSLPGIYMTSKGNPPWFQEKVGVLIQQIGATVAETEGAALNEEQEAYLSQIMPIELIIQNYHPENVDYIKWSDDFNRVYLNETKGEFVKLWLELLPAHFGIYVNAWLKNTYGFWNTHQTDVRVHTKFDSFGQYTEYLSENGFDETQVLTDGMQSVAEKFYTARIFFLSEGICFWILLLVFVLLLRQKRRLALVAIPSLMNYITLFISSPLSGEFRYILLFPYSLPIMVGLLFLPGTAGKQ